MTKTLSFVVASFIATVIVTACQSPVAVNTKGGGGRSFTQGLTLEEEAYPSANASIGDTNGDGHLDIVLVKGRHWPLQNLVRYGDGEGGFSPISSIGPGPDRSYTGELFDLDGDGDLDMLVSNDSPDPKRVLHNDGQGVFTEVQQFGSPDWNTRHLSVADLNGDGLSDVIAANRGGRKTTDSFVCFGVAMGRFSESCEVIYRGSATTITPADVDGDGDVDLIIPHRDGGQSELRLNDGGGGFAESKAFGPPTVGYRSAAVADFDNDGRIDIAIISPGSSTGVGGSAPDGGNQVIAAPRVGVFYGEPELEFSSLKSMTDSVERPYAILAEDVDRDGRTDLIVGFIEAPSTVWFNEGGRKFTAIRFGDGLGDPFVEKEGTTYGFAVDDLNGDGLMDIVVARSDAPNMVYFGK
ncbi:VCBS repeat-containing protein [Congregibacter brevis]|uniref:VCBS repeat-containing protein n=1 Tax=Congregibacter brevis TaxID=3081201 RepID=A0ABZ0ID91_9GAMM|nr:VCBS repeat-containing protein [Congregibacter sp. IMCC45268]